MRTETNWKQIGTAFQSTRRSARDIAREFGVSETAIRKKAKEKNWMRPEPEPDWSEPMRVKQPERSPETAPVEAVQTDPANLEPLELVKRGRSLILALMAELEVENSNIHLLAELVEIETAEDQTVHRRRALEKALSFPVRASAAKNLATALSTLRDAAPSMKDQKAEAAESAGHGSQWSSDLEFAGVPN